MRIRLTVPGEPDEETLGIALEAATRLAQHDVRAGRVPAIEDAIDAGVRWQAEPPGDESFDKPSDVMERGWGDCDDLAPWLAAEMRETNFDPQATAIAVPSGRNTWHAIVQGSNGEIFDPSIWAGMPYNAIGGCMPCSKPLNVGRVGIAIGRRGVRVDVPGLQSRRGCVIGVSHQCNCASTDEDKIVALIETIEDAIVTAQLARTGDPRAIKALAVIYRVMRGEDPETACSEMRVDPTVVGVDFSAPTVRRFIQQAREVLATAADELFAGDTWTVSKGRVVKARKEAIDGDAVLGYAERVGFIPCLAALGPLATVATTVGTIAAVLDPIAAALRELAGKDSDFGRAMATLREVLGPIKIASSLGSGVLSLAQYGNIPMAAQATAARWFELLNAPGSPTARNFANLGTSLQKVGDVAKVLSWTERALAGKLPAEMATRLTPVVIDAVKAGNYEQAVKDMKDKLLTWVKTETGFTGVTPELAEKMALDALKALADHSEPLEIGQQGSRVATLPSAEDWASRTLAEKIEATRTALEAMRASEATPGLIAALEEQLSLLEVEQSQQVREMREPETAFAETIVAEAKDANEVREQLRTVPITLDVPEGWDPIFAMGCLQQWDGCA